MNVCMPNEHITLALGAVAVALVLVIVALALVRFDARAARREQRQYRHDLYRPQVEESRHG